MRVAPLVAAALMVGATAGVVRPAAAQVPAPVLPRLTPVSDPRLPLAVVDARAVMTTLGQDAVTASSLGTAVTNLPTRGFGGLGGVHIYPVRLTSFALGVGADAVIAVSQFQPVDANKKADGPAVRRRLRGVSAQVSGNFGHRDGWSYLTVGFGPTSFETYFTNATPNGLRPSTLNYGGGARWFGRKHIAFTADIRFYATKPAVATTATGARERKRVLVLSAGVSFR